MRDSSLWTIGLETLHSPGESLVLEVSHADPIELST